MQTLDDAIGRIRDRSSLFWGFYDPGECQPTDTVEVRLIGTAEGIATFNPPDGWTVHRIQWGDTVFLRRRQSMAEAAIEAMLCDRLRFAETIRMRFWSWQAGVAHLVPDGFQPPAAKARRPAATGAFGSSAPAMTIVGQAMAGSRASKSRPAIISHIPA